MSQLSRRNFFSSVAAAAVAVPAVAAPAVALTVADTVTHDAGSTAARVARAKQIVELLSTRYIREGWTLDAERAAQFVESIRTLDENDGECPKFTMARYWIHDHGQSLDWVFDGDPGGMITWAAAKSSIGGAVPDPVIALAETATRLHDDHGAAITVFDSHERAWFEWRNENPVPERRGFPHGPEDVVRLRDGKWIDMETGVEIDSEVRAGYAAIVEEDEAAVAKWLRRSRAFKRRSGYRVAEKEAKRAQDASCDAIGKLIGTQPRTLAGLRRKVEALSYCGAASLYGDELVEALKSDLAMLEA